MVVVPEFKSTAAKVLGKNSVTVINTPRTISAFLKGFVHLTDVHICLLP